MNCLKATSEGEPRLSGPEIKEKLADAFQKTAFFICGPNSLTNAITSQLKKEGANKIYTERFTL
ncbi:MAG TPA: hypothetical protein VKS21_12490 [Spirochaetota bacterium]|nr:hypothetical protein [Spirochaetota bacterium]